MPMVKTTVRVDSLASKEDRRVSGLPMGKTVVRVDPPANISRDVVARLAK